MTHTEAPFSLTTKLVDANGFEWLLTVRQGATLQEARAIWKLATDITGGLLDHGVKPASRFNGTSANGNGQQVNGNAPLCSTHGKPMRQSQHGGWFCPVKIADDDGTGRPVYCKQKVKG